MAIFGHSEFIPVFLGKIVGKNSDGHFWPFQIYTSLFGKNHQKKFGTAIFDHSKFFLTNNFSVHITLIQCHGLESNEIWTFLDVYSEILSKIGCLYTYHFNTV